MKIKRTLPSISEILIEKKKLENNDLYNSRVENLNIDSHINIIGEDERKQQKQIFDKIKNSKSKIFRPASRNASQDLLLHSGSIQFTIHPKKDSHNTLNKQYLDQVLKSTQSLQQIEKSASQVSFKNFNPQQQKFYRKERNPKTETQKIIIKDKFVPPPQRPISLQFMQEQSDQQNTEQRLSFRKKIFSQKQSASNLRTESQKNNEGKKQMGNNTHLESKIESLQNLVKELANKLDQSQNQSHNVSLNLSQQKYSRSPIKSYNLDQSYSAKKNSDQMETKRLRMELQQMRRCEKLAKENETLYSRLVEDIRHSPNQTILNRSYGTGTIGSKILQFQDYEGDDGTDDDNNGQISSPFLLEENTKSAYFSVKAHPIHN